jgi:hypothetical protein
VAEDGGHQGRPLDAAEGEGILPRHG